MKVMITTVLIIFRVALGLVLILDDNNNTLTKIDTDSQSTVDQLSNSITQTLINHHMYNYSQLSQFQLFYGQLLISELSGYDGGQTKLHQISIYPDNEPAIVVKALNHFPLMLHKCEFKRQSLTGWSPSDSIITTVVYANSIEIEFYFRVNFLEMPKALNVLNIDNHNADKMGYETRKSLRIGYYYNTFQIVRTMNIKTGIDGLKPETHRVDTTEIPFHYLSLTNHVYLKFTNTQKIIVVNNYQMQQDGDFRIFGQNRVCSVYSGVSRLSEHNHDNTSGSSGLFDDLEMEEQRQYTPISFKHLCINTNVEDFQFLDEKTAVRLVQRLAESERKKHEKRSCCVIS